MKPAVIALALAFSACAGAALADPCKAVPDRGPAPAWLKPGSVFTGAVRYVGDGDMICVGRSPDPATWVEVRLSDFYAPELSEPGGAAARDALRRLVMGRPVRCIAGRQSYDRIVASCSLGGKPIGDLMRAAGVAEGGRGWLSGQR